MARRNSGHCCVIFLSFFFLAFMYVTKDMLQLNNRSLDDEEMATNPTNKQTGLLESLGVHPRPYTMWNMNIPLPCFAPEKKWFSRRVGKSPATEGFLFVKSPKTGSSTGAGINLRIASNVAQKQQVNNMTICKNRFHHGTALQRMYQNRNKTRSFLWSIVREPTARVISRFFHFQVARKRVEPTDENVIDFLKHGRHQHQLEYLTLENMRNNDGKAGLTQVEAVNKILKEYNFLGVTERMDESAVALQMLLGLEMTDVMYISSSKASGGYDDGKWKNKCHLIPKAFLSPTVEKHLQSKEWQDIVYWDEILHKAANVSLDMTIERLGHDEFQRNLRAFRLAKQQIADECSEKVLFPCSSDGKRIPEKKTHCIYADNGCGFKCIDDFFNNQNTSSIAFS